MLGFDDAPGLVEDTRTQPNILTLPLTEDFDFTTNFQDSTTSFSTNSWDHPDPAFSLVPINSTVTSPRDKVQLMSAATVKPLQLCYDLFSFSTDLFSALS